MNAVKTFSIVGAAMAVGYMFFRNTKASLKIVGVNGDTIIDTTTKQSEEKPKTIFELTLENCQSEGEWPLSEEKEILKKEFEEAFYSIQTEIPFNDKWHNGTGYLDGGVRDDLGLEEGQGARSIDPLTGRKIIIIGVVNRNGKLTNCLHFERNIPGKGSYCLVSNYDYLDAVPSWK